MSDTTTKTREEGASDDDAQAQDLLADAVEEEDTDDTETDDTGDEDDDTGDDTEEQDTKPAPKAPAGKDDKVDRAELTKVVRERQEAKKALRAARKELEDIKRANEGETERAQREAREAAAAEIEGKYKPLVIRTSAEAALISAGVVAGEDDPDARKKKIARVVRLMNLDDIEVGDNGEVDGIDAQIEELQEEYPELFAQPEPEPEPKPKPRSAKAADGADKPPARKKVSAEQQIMAKLRGGR